MTDHKNVNDLIVKVNGIINMLETFISDYGYLMNELEMDMSSVKDCETIFKKANESIKVNFSKLTRRVLKCVVFGRVSTGKSALLNALLSNDILPSDDGPVTNSFIELHKSDDDTDFVIFADSPTIRRDISCIKLADEMADEKANDAIPLGSHIDLYYSTSPLLNDDVVIVDTPGIDADKTMDTAIHRECEGADVLILLVSAEIGMSNCERDFLTQHRGQFSNLKVLIVFNKWEVPHSKPGSRCVNLREKYRNNAEKCLRECLNVREEDLAGRIYFISAKERLNIIMKDNGNVLPGCDTRDRDFDEFFDNLKTMMREGCGSRSQKLMRLVCEALDQPCNSIIHNRLGSAELCDHFVENLNSLEQSNEQITRKTIAVFDAKFESLFGKALRIVKMLDGKERTVIESRLKLLIYETLDETVGCTKVIIRDMVSKSEFPNRNYIMKTLETFYFPSYFDLSNKIESWNMGEFRNTIDNINGIVKVYTGIVNGEAQYSSFVRGAPGAAGGSIAIGVATGGSFADGTFATSVRRMPFSPRYKEHGDKIKKEWQSMEYVITESFCQFLSDLRVWVNHHMTRLDDKSTAILGELHSLETLVGEMA